jgi:hypothetical protein
MHRSTLAFLLLIAFVSIAFGLHSVRARQPTSEQRNAIRSACRSDFIANCAGVEPGGKEAFECLLRSHDNLSASCKTAVDAVAAKLQAPAAPAAEAPPPAAAPAPAAGPSPAANSSQTAAPSSATPPASTVSQEELNAVRGACTLNDIAEHCSFIAPSTPEIVLCLRANRAGLSRGGGRLRSAAKCCRRAAAGARTRRPAKFTRSFAVARRDGCSARRGSRGRAWQTHGRASLRDPLSLPVRLHGELLRRSTGRACGPSMLAE